MPSTNQTFDLIVIGSGMGGLSVASLMSQMKHKRVLVLERHFKLGGFTHSFTRPKNARGMWGSTTWAKWLPVC